MQSIWPCEEPGPPELRHGGAASAEIKKTLAQAGGERHQSSGSARVAAVCPAASATLVNTPVDMHLSLHKKPLPDHGQSRFALPRRYLAACDCLHCCVLEREPLFAGANASRPRSCAAGRRQLCSLKGKANSCACDSCSSRDILSPNIRNRLQTASPEGSI